MPQDTSIAARDHYLAELRRINHNGIPVWARKVREYSRHWFSELSFPYPEDECWRFTDITPILDKPYRLADHVREAGPEIVQPHLFQEPEWLELVFIDGVYRQALSRAANSPGGVCVAPLALAAPVDVLRRHFNRHLNESDAFSALNSAALRDGSFVYVPAGHERHAMVHIVFLTTGTEPDTVYFPRNLIVAGGHTRLTVVESHVAPEGAAEHFCDAVTEVVVEQHAEVSYGKYIAQNGGHHLGTVHIVQQEDSRFSSTCVTTSGGIVRNAMHMAFDGARAECRLEGLYLNSGGQLVDHTLEVNHARPECRSRIAYKGIIAGNGRAVFRGGVRVHRDARRTDSHQVNRNLLLSDHARVDTTPKLEIFADDVRCTHGATVGSPPEDMIFYFRSRGIDEAAARNMLTAGFAREIIERIDADPWRARLQRYLEEEFFRTIVKGGVHGNE